MSVAVFPFGLRADGEATALLAPGRPVLSHAGLRHQIRSGAQALASAGVRRGDVVAVLLPNGPELATAVLTAGYASIAAPLNPALTEAELRAALSDLGATLLLTDRQICGRVAGLAGGLGLRLAVLAHDEGLPAGTWWLDHADQGADPPVPNGAGDTVLLLQTSGTTARPKRVGLTAGNLAASVAAVVDSLGLGPADRGLNLMPLFHVHGIVAGLAAPLAAGGSVVVSPGFDALRTFGWLRDHRPNWLTAVPTMYQALLARAARHDPGLLPRLRFVRSSSAALPEATGRGLAALFGCPVIEAYGMTEAAHQISSMRPDDLQSLPGTVGSPDRTEVRILGERGQPLPKGCRGQIAIRGASVHKGYLGNPGANAEAFRDGWFLTGDEGLIEPGGQLRLTGRLKEQIHRGGQKISPLEIEAALADYPDVVAGICFPISHPMLGQEVAAAVVPRADSALTTAELSHFLAGRLARFKVPARILLVDEIPLGPSGKIQRLALSRLFGLEPHPNEGSRT